MLMLMLYKRMILKSNDNLLGEAHSRGKAEDLIPSLVAHHTCVRWGVSSSSQAKWYQLHRQDLNHANAIQENDSEI